MYDITAMTGVIKLIKGKPIYNRWKKNKKE